MAVEEDVALLVEELERLERDAGELLELGQLGLGQRLDQSERTKTTLPAGIVPWSISHLRMSETFSE